MRKYICKSIFVLTLTTFFISSCNDDRALVVQPDFFKVLAADYQKLISDTLVINVNDKVTFNFTTGCPDELLFYSGESKKEYRFSDRNGLYRQSDGTQFESKVIVNTIINSFDASIPRSYSLVGISGIGKATKPEFMASTKIAAKSLRSNASIATALADTLTINVNSTPINIYGGDISFGIMSKSSEATKNLLSVANLTILNTETRDYGYTKNGVTVVNKKTISYPVIASFADAAWAQYAPDSTITPGASLNSLNASGYSWNTGEIGVNYTPSITGGTVSKNLNGLALVTAYPISVTAPADASKVVALGTAPYEAWLISKPVNLCNSILTPTSFSDAPVFIKKVDQSSVKYYQYTYAEKGVYKATFVGINVGTNGTAKVVREFVILVKGSTDNL
jgi:hypothetical protein